MCKRFGYDLSCANVPMIVCPVCGGRSRRQGERRDRGIAEHREGRQDTSRADATLWHGSERKLGASFALSIATTSRTPGRELDIRIEPGNFGPIQDRVILERAILLMERPAR